ncbi:zinc-binding alcohol dehydrogenase family protein [Paracoccus sp. 11-3]|uniref:Zinc-binding alcohol dehydrogenase family protein n=1 Tax=Paracoccus amoyensis TaxID=2760093 RepID=A0A926GCV2_9RHOB|nr:zinc-binding alcohol dehydrogenase family protein [Paracoccus amoyensis]MBC9246121.1 zinc-binding alcohol dehydrogenase family protein [Paracoccus amoyensis]
MKAAIVTKTGETPAFSDFQDPIPQAGEQLVHVRAAAISQLARARASGTHYSFEGIYPFIAGVDGVGQLQDGRRVYFAFPKAPYGAMAQQVAMSPEKLAPVPDDLDDITAAAIVNPGMSSWMALRERAAFQPGETVLINGATGSAGQLAVQITRHMGAKRIIATGRNPQALSRLKTLGADHVISLTDDDVPAQFAEVFEAGIDIVLDYLWGSSAEQILNAAAQTSHPADPTRFVQIGSVSNGSIALPAAAIRSSAITLMGSGIGSVAPDRMVASIKELLASAGSAGFQIATTTAPLSDIATAWQANTGTDRMVITVDG